MWILELAHQNSRYLPELSFRGNGQSVRIRRKRIRCKKIVYLITIISLRFKRWAKRKSIAFTSINDTNIIHFFVKRFLEQGKRQDRFIFAGNVENVVNSS